MAALSFRCALDVGPPLSSFISSMESRAVCHAGGPESAIMKSMTANYRPPALCVSPIFAAGSVAE